MFHNAKRAWRKALFLPLFLTLGGCAVMTPEPFTDKEHQKRIARDMGRLFASQEPIEEPIGLYDAMARAIKYNLDQRIKLMESALAQHQLTAANLDLLPELAGSAAYLSRDNFSGSNSRSLLTGEESLAVSTSQDRNRAAFDMGLTWNILDFGVSYVSAKQQADRGLIAEERRRKVVHNIIQDVRSAYWNAISAERLLARINPLINRVETALNHAREIQKKKLKPPLEALRYRRELLDIMRQLKGLERQLSTARTELTALMNVHANEDFELITDIEEMSIPEIKPSPTQLEKWALLYRPELREEAYKTRISAEEVKKAMLRMLPGIEFSSTYNVDTNSYAYESHWWDYAARINLNLFNVFTGPVNIDIAEAQKDVVQTRRFALSLAVMSQVHVGLIGFQQSAGEFRTLREMLEVEGGILDQVKARTGAAADGEMELIRAELNAVLAELRRDMAYADMQNAVGRIFVSVGADPLPAKVASHDLAHLSEVLKETTQGWLAGRVNLPGEEAEKMAAVSSVFLEEKTATKTPAPSGDEERVAEPEIPKSWEYVPLKVPPLALKKSDFLGGANNLDQEKTWINTDESREEGWLTSYLPWDPAYELADREGF